MKIPFKQKQQYRFEQYLNKGGASIFISLFVVFIVLFLLMILFRWIAIMIWPELHYTDSFAYDIWLTWLQMTDPGNMNQDNHSPRWLKITTILSGVIGVIILSMLIAFITTALEKLFYNFRKGRGPVLEEDHTLILGWNERVVDIVRELILANESEKYAAVVILSTEEKEEMDDMIAKRIPNSQTTRIITTTGDYANINELKRVSVAHARSIILLANCSESATEELKEQSDVQSVKAIMAIIASQGGENQLPIIAEVFNEDKRKLIGYFEDDNLITLNSWEIMGKLFVQTSLTSGLEMVYNEILSFDGCEIYFHEEDCSNIAFGQLPFHFKDGIPLGIYNEQDGVVLRPGKDYALKPDDQIIILAEDDSTINFEAESIYSPKDIALRDSHLEQQKKSILILGWHSIADVFISESADYLKDGSKFDILFNEPSEELTAHIESLQEAFPKFEIQLKRSNPLIMNELVACEPFNYDNIIILSQDSTEQHADKIDSDTLIILLLLRKIKLTLGEVHTKIITQVLNSENQDIITQTDVDDFIISNKLITMILAQLSEQPLILQFYEDIFSEDGSEIYVKRAELYCEQFPVTVAFGDLIKLADKRDEICLGIRKGSESKNAGANFGVTLNLAKDDTFVLEGGDFLVVLSEDEL